MFYLALKRMRSRLEDNNNGMDQVARRGLLECLVWALEETTPLVEKKRRRMLQDLKYCLK